MNTWLKRVAFLLLTLLFVIAAVLVAMMPEPKVAAENRLVLSDGRVLRVEAVTAGTSHVYRTGPGWLEKLQGSGPRWLRDKLGPEVRTMRRTSRSETVLPWISVTIGPGKPAPQWRDIHVVADGGEVFDIASRSFPGSFKDRRFMLPQLDVFPRRDPFFSVTGFVARLPFSLRIANPLHEQTHPEWKTAPVPATNHVNGFDVVLHRPQIIRTRSREYFSVDLKAFEAGRELKDWFNFAWDLSDATGNRGHKLPTNEPAWRINLKLSRKFAARWATNEFREVVVSNLPPGGELLEFPVSARLGGVDIERVWFAGAGEYVIENGVFTIAKPSPPGGGETWRSSSSGPSDWEMTLKRHHPWIMIKRSGRSSDHTLAAFLTDATGKQVPVSRRGSTGTGGFYADIFEVGLSRQPPVAPLTLRIAGEEYLRTEFVVAPDQIKRVDRTTR